jgi:LEA14-like dessication related protein
MSTYNITLEKAQKLLLAFPHPIMYVNGPPNSIINEFVKIFKTSGYNVVSIQTLKKICKTDESFLNNIRKKIYNASDPIMIYGQLTLDQLDQIFGEKQFSYIYVYPNSKKFKERVKVDASAQLKAHSKIYKSHLERYEKMLVVVE